MNTIIRIGYKHPVIEFAASELARYLRAATGQPAQVTDGIPRPAGAGAVVFQLGLSHENPDDWRGEDDWIAILPEGNGYYLCGSNPRSVLFAVYRYLHELGFRWIRPGRRGEIVPRLRSPLRRGIHILEGASYRYRTICIEGACSEQHVLDLIDWMAKQGMNGYFIQFNNGTEFWKRWYTHIENPTRKPEPFAPARAGRIVTRVAREIEKRGLRFERVGHGWTCAALGVEAEGWSRESDRQVPRGKRPWMAEIDGKRRLFQGMPINTNLCYSNPDVRNAMTARIAAYAAAHPEVTELHLWLADGANNNCECRNCRKARPADFYVDILNELDERLTAAGLSTRIVFLIYVDLLWPPIKRRIRNPERFVLMFAPITRSYLESFASGRGRKEPITPYVRNKLKFPKGAAENIAHVRAWRKLFKGDGFDFDYHMIWPCYYDLAMMTLARVLHEDIRGLADIELDGFNSCQNQRQSFPHNLLMDVMARTLWNRDIPFRRIVRESFGDAYGHDGMKVALLLSRMSELNRPFFESVHIPHTDLRRAGAGLGNLPKMAAIVDRLKHMAMGNVRRTTGAVRWSWKYLAIYAELMKRLLPAYEAYLQHSPDCRKRFEKALAYAQRKETVIHPILDLATLTGVLRWRVNEVENSGPKGVV